tara:strand:+ start:778 stop:912 length:135 start_codon:yes stop_codon:yes gene_type:complete
MTEGKKRDEIRQYIIQKGVRIPAGNKPLNFADNVPEQEVGKKKK